jgi:uncharacterized DUF497 family protein
MGPLEPRVAWDAPKAATNLAKHGVSFEEARDAMDDPFARDRSDPLHSLYENRHVLMGESPQGRLLIVIYVIRGDFAWLISAREMTRRERRIYMNDRNILADRPLDDDMLPEYGNLDGWGPPHRHFPKMQGSVMLDPDVFDVFRTSEEVNDALRILIREGRVPHAPYEHTLAKRD